MSLLLYAITDLEGVDATGIGGAALSLVRGGGLSAVVGDDRAAPQADEQRLWEYEHAVETLMAAGTILPARFGTVLADEHAVHTLLRRDRDEFRRSLDRVRGTVEMGVRVQWGDGPPGKSAVAGEPGTAYLMARLALVRAARSIAERVGTVLAPLARHTTISVLPRRGVPVLAAYLVEAARAAAFADRCRRLDQELSQVELACTGPWPPYSFVRGAEGA